MQRDERGFFVLKSAPQLEWYARYIAGEDNTACAVLGDDIDYTAYNSMIGQGTAYNGTFDGAGHTITINMQRSSDYA